MGKAARKFKLVEGGSAMRSIGAIAEPIAEPLRNLEKWLTADALADLAGVSDRMARKAIAGRTWRGVDLLVREVEIGRGGAGGRALQVHVDSLPGDLRAAWYLERGIRLHEAVDAESGETLLIPEQAWRNDARHEADLAIARWRLEVIRPVLALERRSAARAALIREMAAQKRLLPNGRRKALTIQTIYNWVAAFEAEGLYGLMRKRRADSGARRTAVTRAWDRFFAAHIDEATHNDVADEITRYIRSLWGAGERGWRAISEKSTTRLIELSRDLRVVAFEGLELGRCGDTTRAGTQFGLCHINRRMIEKHRDYRILAVQAKDNATFQDRYMPSIRRDYSDLVPREIVVGDVHPVDIMMRRADGNVVYPTGPHPVAGAQARRNPCNLTCLLPILSRILAQIRLHRARNP